MIKSIIKRTSAAALALCILCLMVMTALSLSAAAEETGSVTVRVYNEFEGIPLCIVELGTYVDGKIELDKQYAGLDIHFDELKTSGEMDEAANQIQAFVKKKGIMGTVRWINAEGNVIFDKLPLNKLYFIMQTLGEEVVKIQPLVLTLPTYTDGEAVKDVVAKAKYVDNRSADTEGAVIVNKLGHKDVVLPGAVFEFSQKVYYSDASKLKPGVETGEDETGKYYWKTFKKMFITDENGQIVINELAFATYRFVEIQAPDGYILDPTPHEFDIAKHGTVRVENGRYIAVNDGTKVLTIRNSIDDYGEQSGEASDIDIQESVLDISVIEESGGFQESVLDISVIEEKSILDMSIILEESEERSRSQESGQSGDDGKVELTGDDIVKYCTTGAVVCTSLAVIILLIVIGNRSSKKEE